MTSRLTVETTSAGETRLPDALVELATGIPPWAPLEGPDLLQTTDRPSVAALHELAHRLAALMEERLAVLEDLLGRALRPEQPGEDVDPEAKLLDAIEAAINDVDEGAYRSLLAELRDIQEAEARRMREYFEAHRAFPEGAGYRVLAQARALLEGDENPPDANGPAPAADKAQEAATSAERQRWLALLRLCQRTLAGAKAELRRYRAIPHDSPGQCPCGGPRALPPFLEAQTRRFDDI